MKTKTWSIGLALVALSTLAIAASPMIKGAYPYFDLTAFNGIATGSLPSCASGVAAGEGWFAFDSTTKTMKYCNGTAWGNVGIDPLSVASNIIPATDLTYNLGSSTKAWSGVFMQTLNSSSTGQVRLNIQNANPSTYYGHVDDNAGNMMHKFANILSLTAANDRYIAAFYRDSVTNRMALVDTNGNFRISATGFAAPVVHGTNAANAKDIETGTSTFSTGTKAITFTTAFGANPNCVCTTTSATVPCSISVNPSTTGVTFAGTGSDTFWYECIGTR